MPYCQSDNSQKRMLKPEVSTFVHIDEEKCEDWKRAFNSGIPHKACSGNWITRGSCKIRTTKSKNDYQTLQVYSASLVSRSDSSRLLAVRILKFLGVLIPSIQSIGVERCGPPRAVMYTERVMIVSEHYQGNLQNLEMRSSLKSPKLLARLAFEILDAFSYLHMHDVIHRCLSPQSIRFDCEGHVKLSNYGLYYITECGTTVSFPIGSKKRTGFLVICRLDKVFKSNGIVKQKAVGERDLKQEGITVKLDF
ncbi:TBC domain-containing protein kinase-like protein [Trichonephila clavipes]|nr:TBC domain-containing protein kinase-like protein [Trichonephila clavipes]